MVVSTQLSQVGGDLKLWGPQVVRVDSFFDSTVCI